MDPSAALFSHKSVVRTECCEFLLGQMEQRGVGAIRVIGTWRYEEDLLMVGNGCCDLPLISKFGRVIENWSYDWSILNIVNFKWL